jgi:hypothetical protein
MNFSKAVAFERSPKLGVALQIIACVVAAVWLTAVVDFIVLRVTDWVYH